MRVGTARLIAFMTIMIFLWTIGLARFAIYISTQ